MAVEKIVELIGSSLNSLEEAAGNAVKRALENVTSFHGKSCKISCKKPAEAQKIQRHEFL